MNDKLIRWGIIGPGRIAHKFAQDLQQVAGAKLMAVASRNATRAGEFAQQYDAPYVYGSYEEIVTCPELDVVYIASPHIGHHQHTLLCLRAGVAVLCEKPFAMNRQQVQEMVETARQNNVFLMEALWSRFNPAIWKALELVKNGAIGKVHLLKADFGFKGIYDPHSRLFNKNLGGGSLLDIGIYPLFLAYAALGMPQDIQATAYIGSTGVDETCGLILKYANDAVAVLDSSFRVKTRCEASIYGEKGTIYLHPRWHETKQLTVEYDEGETETFDFERSTWGYDYEIQEVNQCLRNNQKESANWSLNDSLNLIELLDSTRELIGLHYDE